MEYELHNPSDPYTFIAENREVDTIAVALISTAFGADTQDKNPESHVPIFLFGGFDEWYKETFGREPMEGLDALRDKVIEALSSFMLGHFSDRARYNAALEAITDPIKREQFIEKWQDGRSSLNDIGGKAHRIAKRMKERAEA